MEAGELRFHLQSSLENEMWESDPEHISFDLGFFFLHKCLHLFFYSICIHIPKWHFVICALSFQSQKCINLFVCLWDFTLPCLQFLWAQSTFSFLTHYFHFPFPTLPKQQTTYSIAQKIYLTVPTTTKCWYIRKLTHCILHFYLHSSYNAISVQVNQCKSEEDSWYKGKA